MTGQLGSCRQAAAVKHDQPPYSTRYPKLATDLDNRPQRPLGNEIRNNVCLGGLWLDIRGGFDKSWAQLEGNFADSDSRLGATGGRPALDADHPARSGPYRPITHPIGPRQKRR
ncbi:MAG: hypothetical protein ACOCZE_08685 [Planctomycetota bacterium]